MKVCGTESTAAIVLFTRILERIQNEPCCFESAEDGPTACSCWEPVYDLEQQATIAVSVEHIQTRPEMCADCAFRPDSPERQGDDRYNHAGDDEIRSLDHFWCHQGMRKPVAYRHPYGITLTADHDAYDPPIRTIDGVGVPFKASGAPGDRCGGFDAWKRVGALQSPTR
jgi:hypothetical protein